MDRHRTTSSESPEDPAASGVDVDERPEGRIDNVSAEVVGHDYVLHDGATGQVHFLNQTAALVWDLCDGTRTLREIAAEVARLYGRPADVVVPDVQRAVGLLRDHDLFLRSARA